MSNSKNKPHVSKEVLTWLRDVFPNCVPKLDDSERLVWSKVGQQDVIRHLQKLFDEQETN